MKINANNVEFHCGRQIPFDAIVFATGYKSTVNTWLKVQRLLVVFFFKSLGLDNNIVVAYIIFFSLLQMDNPFFAVVRMVKACLEMMVFPRKNFQIIGEVKMGSIVLGLQGEDWSVLPWMPRILLMTSEPPCIKCLAKFGSFCFQRMVKLA